MLMNDVLEIIQRSHPKAKPQLAGPRVVFKQFNQIHAYDVLELYKDRARVHYRNQTTGYTRRGYVYADGTIDA